MDTAWRWGREEGCMGCWLWATTVQWARVQCVHLGLGFGVPEPAAAQGLEDISQSRRAALATGGCFVRRQRASGALL